MNHDHVIRLLAVITAYDRRTIGDFDIRVFTEAAQRAGWTLNQAVDAVHAHYAHSTDWLQPGHITARIRQERRQPARYDRRQVGHAKASDTQRQAAMARIRAALRREAS